jgi:hypothetical protein
MRGEEVALSTDEAQQQQDRVSHEARMISQAEMIDVHCWSDRSEKRDQRPLPSVLAVKRDQQVGSAHQFTYETFESIEPKSHSLERVLPSFRKRRRRQQGRRHPYLECKLDIRLPNSGAELPEEVEEPAAEVEREGGWVGGGAGLIRSFLWEVRFELGGVDGDDLGCEESQQ